MKGECETMYTHQIRWKFISFVLGLLIGLCLSGETQEENNGHGGSSGDKAVTGGVPLTLEETIGIALSDTHRQYTATGLGPYLDKRAKTILIDQFDALNVKSHISILRVIGMLGDSKEDVLFVESRMVEHAKRVMNTNAVDQCPEFAISVLACIEGVFAIAEMAHNEIPYAKDLLMQMTYPQYWHDKQIEWDSYIEDLPYEGLFRAVALANGLFPAQFSDVTHVLVQRFETAGIQLTPEQKKKFRGVITMYGRSESDIKKVSEVLRNTEYKKRLRDHYTIFAAGQYAKGLGLPAPPIIPNLSQTAQQSYANKKFTDRLEEPGLEFISVEEAKNPSERELLVQLVQEALDFFAEIKTHILGKNYDTVWDHLLDNGNPLDQEAIAKLHNSEYLLINRYREGVDVQAELLAAISEDMNMSLEFAKVGRWANHDDIFVMIFLHDSAKIAQKVLGNTTVYQRSQHFTVTEDGDLVLVMRRIKGEWYWNPFCW